MSPCHHELADDTPRQPMSDAEGVWLLIAADGKLYVNALQVGVRLSIEVARRALGAARRWTRPPEMA
jgi:hypothetical protein